MNDFELNARLHAHSDAMKESISAPFDIHEELQKMEETKMTKKTVSADWLKKTVYTAAGLAAAFVLTFNCAPSLAYAASDIPVLGALVRIVTFDRFDLNGGNYEASVTTPKVEGLLDAELQQRLNAELAGNAAAVIAAFEQDVRELGEQYGDENFHLAVTADYTVRTDSEEFLAVDCFVTTTEASAATTHRFYTIDKKTGALVDLPSLFKAGADYEAVINAYLIAEMERLNESEGGMFFVGEQDVERFEGIRADQSFFVNESGNIVICFDEYEVASGAQGSPEFELPREVTADILK